MRNLPPLNEVRAFEAAARHMSFGKAAVELRVTPTAISHQIKLLEEYCGQPLFRRWPRPITLTDAGSRLFSVVRDGLDSFSTAFAALREGTDHRPLKVSATNAFACRWLVPRLPDWGRIHPGHALEVIGTDDVLDLRAGEADVAIRYAFRQPTGLVAHELFRDRFYPIGSPGLFSDEAPIRRPSDLLRFPLIHCLWPSWNLEAPTWRRWSLMARQSDPDFPEIGETGSMNFREELHAIAAVMAGQGISILSDVVVARELEAGQLVKALDLPIPGLGFYLVHAPGHPRQVAIDALLSWLMSREAQCALAPESHARVA
ncbi:MAG TPA: LysR substrate-binding domain-containing protein [Dongiaceae bacterium]|nr:LysR substrate-binding domain-containing protein [Dongiaceae bacterium]